MNEVSPLPEHSSAKVRLLGAYLKRFLSVISNDGFTRQIDIYDLFCGEGQGSPTIIMNAVKESYFARRNQEKGNPKINCSFNDNDKSKVDSAAEIIQTRGLYYPEFGDLQFTNRDYVDAVKDLIQNLQSSQKDKKTFVFIDPYGYKHIKASQIKDLMFSRNIEVLLFLPTQFMYRFDANGTPEALSDFVSEIVDVKDWKPNESVWNYIEQLRDGFKRKLGTDFFVDTFSIQKDPQTVFCLFFFSGHIKGFEKMLEAKWELDEEQGKGWHYTSSLSASLFSSQKTNPLENRLIEFLGSGLKSNGQLYEFTLQCGFLPKHATEVLSALKGEKRLSVVDIKGEPISRGFFISYQNFRDAPSKARFQLI